MAILDRYRDRLEEGEIYGISMLRRTGAKAHDWFAGVQVADGYVKFNFLPMHGHPDLLDGTSQALRKHKTGASVFRFTEVPAPPPTPDCAITSTAPPAYDPVPPPDLASSQPPGQ